MIKLQRNKYRYSCDGNGRTEILTFWNALAMSHIWFLLMLSSYFTIENTYFRKLWLKIEPSNIRLAPIEKGLIRKSTPIYRNWDKVDIEFHFARNNDSGSYLVPITELYQFKRSQLEGNYSIWYLTKRAIPSFYESISSSCKAAHALLFMLSRMMVWSLLRRPKLDSLLELNRVKTYFVSSPTETLTFVHVVAPPHALSCLSDAQFIFHLVWWLSVFTHFYFQEL